jgi:hypothetical protein
MQRGDRAADFRVYVFGRPLMFALWALSLWGTVTAVRLAWLYLAGDTANALRLARLPTVWGPIAVAALMWIGLVLALRRFRRSGEP